MLLGFDADLRVAFAQEYLNIVEKSVDRMERRVDAVDNAFGGTQLKKFFSSIVVRVFAFPSFPVASSASLSRSLRVFQRVV